MSHSVWEPSWCSVRAGKSTERTAPSAAYLREPRVRECSADSSSRPPISKFDGLISHSTRAHRLCLKAWKLGGQALQQEFLEVLFKAFFTDGKNIGDPELLGEIAETSGVMSKAEVRYVSWFGLPP